MRKCYNIKAKAKHRTIVKNTATFACPPFLECVLFLIAFNDLQWFSRPKQEMMKCSHGCGRRELTLTGLRV